MKTTIVNNISVTLADNVSPESLGLLPQMILGGSECPVTNIETNYPWFFGWDEDTAATVDEFGVYRYPNDEPLEFMAKYEGDEISLYQYPYGIVAAVKGSKLIKTTRCD
jgi:hypothetical protein